MPKLRKLKYHEQKLLKKVDFLSWESDGSPEFRQYVLKTISKYGLKDHTEFFKYQKIVNEVNSSLKEINSLSEEHKDFKIEQTKRIQEKLFQMGVIPERDYDLKKINVGMICQRRLSYLLYKNHFAESVSLASMYISHGHVRIGPEVITDPAYLVTRNLEDFITWVDESSIKKTILKFNGEHDDYNELNC